MCQFLVYIANLKRHELANVCITQFRMKIYHNFCIIKSKQKKHTQRTNTAHFLFIVFVENGKSASFEWKAEKFRNTKFNLIAKIYLAPIVRNSFWSVKMCLFFSVASNKFCLCVLDTNDQQHNGHTMPITLSVLWLECMSRETTWKTLKHDT